MPARDAKTKKLAHDVVAFAAKKDPYNYIEDMDAYDDIEYATWKDINEGYVEEIIDYFAELDLGYDAGDEEEAERLIGELRGYRNANGRRGVPKTPAIVAKHAIREARARNMSPEQRQRDLNLRLQMQRDYMSRTR